jgi:hypothetical protein
MADRHGKRRHLYAYPAGRWIRFRWMWLARRLSVGSSSGRLQSINDTKSVAVIGRGHGGTRLIASTLRLSGVFTGAPTNSSEDLVPPYDLYDACQIMARHVKYRGSYQWKFDKLFQVEVDEIFVALVESFLSSLVNCRHEFRGWKLPETNLIFPWIVRLLPEIKYIYWVRDPRDCILGPHRTDDLRRFNIPFRPQSDLLELRAASWKYQYDIVKATPAPKRLITIRFEDFVQNQAKELERLEEFLGLKLIPVPVDASRIAVWKHHPQYRELQFLRPAMADLGYV